MAHTKKKTNARRRVDNLLSVRTGKRRDLVVTYEDPQTLLPDRDNPRKITPAKRARLKRGIERFGLAQPFLVRGETSVVIGGHQRLDIAKEIGLELVPVTRLYGLTDSEARALGILLNNQDAQGEWEPDMLANVLQRLQKDQFDLELTGFGESELTRLLRDLEGKNGTGSEDSADLTPPTKPKSKAGDVYTLGNHRLLCGDSTVPNVWAQLLPGGGSRRSTLDRSALWCVVRRQNEARPHDQERRRWRSSDPPAWRLYRGR